MFKKWKVTVFVLSLLSNCLFIPTSIYFINYLGGPKYVLNKFKKRTTSIIHSEDDHTIWTDVKDIGINGKGWDDQIDFYNRLPDYAKSEIPKSIWKRSIHTAGLYVHFVSDSTFIKARWVISENVKMHHMAETGSAGVDLYARDGSTWRWAGMGCPTKFNNSDVLISNMEPTQKEFILYLPLYNGIESIELGISPNSVLQRTTNWDHKKPICFYGTSITQGGCASRPGMAYPAILGRWLNCPTINLGFSDTGRMEKEMAILLSEIDARIFVIDCLPNMRNDEVDEKALVFVEILRQSCPDVPILLVDSNFKQNGWILSGKIEKTKTYRNVYEHFFTAGDENIFYLKGDGIVGLDSEASVDGIHLTDLGFMRLAKNIYISVQNIPDLF